MKKKKRQYTMWCLTHEYPNGYVRGGIVSNSKYGTKFDVIAFEDLTISVNKKDKGKKLSVLRHMSLDEAIAWISVLQRALQIYFEKFKPITNKKLRKIYGI